MLKMANIIRASRRPVTAIVDVVVDSIKDATGTISIPTGTEVGDAIHLCVAANHVSSSGTFSHSTPTGFTQYGGTAGGTGSIVKSFTAIATRSLIDSGISPAVVYSAGTNGTRHWFIVLKPNGIVSGIAGLPGGGHTWSDTDGNPSLITIGSPGNGSDTSEPWYQFAVGVAIGGTPSWTGTFPAVSTDWGSDGRRIGRYRWGNPGTQDSRTTDQNDAGSANINYAFAGYLV